MDPALLRSVVLGIGVPTALAFVLGWAMLRPRRVTSGNSVDAREGDTGGGVGVLASLGALAAVLIAAIMSQVYFGRVTSLSITSSDGRMLASTLVLAVLGIAAIGVLSSTRGGWSWAIAGGMSLASVGVLIAPQVLSDSAFMSDNGLTMKGRAVLGLLAAGPLAMLTSAALQRTLQTGRPIAHAVLAAGLTLACGAALLGTGASKTAHYAVAMGLACLALGAWVIIRRGKTGVATAACAVLTALLAMLLIGGVLFAKTPAWLAIAMALVAPVGALVGWCVERAIGGGAAGGRGRLVGVAIVASAAVFAGACVTPGIISLSKIEGGADESP